MIYSTLVKDEDGAGSSSAGSHPWPGHTKNPWTSFMALRLLGQGHHSSTLASYSFICLIMHQQNGGSSNTVYPCFLLTVWVLALFHLNLFHLNLEIRENFTPPNPKYSLPSQCSLFGPQYTSALQGAHPLLCFDVAHVYLPTAGGAYEKGAWGLKSSPNPLNNISWRLRPPQSTQVKISFFLFLLFCSRYLVCKQNNPCKVCSLWWM